MTCLGKIKGRCENNGLADNYNTYSPQKDLFNEFVFDNGFTSFAAIS